ncbi:hypothetical protein [Salegentibacter sediminis]|uniref:hypothetical protein n=1 Tax=Salegentibacter sediminis TaxID=1930251 RepID=UPI0009BDF9FE|nr:hypothetical protein [Salegentibacter sediminis]
MNYLLKWPLALFLLLLNLSVYSQEEHHEESQEPEHLRDIFRESHLHGHIRNYFMNTINRGDLKDYYTNATGGAVGFTTGNYKGFEAGVKGIFTYKTFGNDLGMEDPITGKNARYEYELYDVLNKGNFKDLDRLEELFIRYRFGNSYLTYGKIETEYTPLLNHSDGRMKPFAHRGGWAHFNFGRRHQFNLGWLNGMSPRATTEWFNFEEGLGLFYNGFQPNGEEAHYHEYYESSGMGIFNYRYRRNNISFKVYDFYLDKVMNTLWTEVDYEFNDFNLGIQYVYQSPFSYNEELAYEHRYVQPGENGQVLSSQLSWQRSRLRFAAAYTHAFDTGRFLFPKELGRDHFFTSISRSRLEGMGNVDIVALKGEYTFLKPNLHLGVEMQQILGAEPGEFKYNKYNVDESFQVNTHLRYNVEGFLDGLSFDLLWVYRENQNHLDAESIFNKSNFNQINFVTNFYF